MIKGWNLSKKVGKNAQENKENQKLREKYHGS